LSSDVNIRELELEDYDEVEKIWKLTDLFNSRDNKGRYEKILKQNKDLFLIAEKEDQIIGTVYGVFPYMWFSLPTFGIGYVGHLAVHPDAQGFGVGSKLLVEICNRLKKRGKSRVFLFAHSSGGRNEDLYEFYREKHGFSNISDLFFKRL